MDDNTELFLPLSLNDANKLMIEDKEGQYISENNSDFLIETSMTKNISIHDSFFRPYMLSNIDYDYIFGSKNSYTPLRYNLNYRNYYLVLEGKIRIKMTPPKNEKYLYCNKDYDNFEFRSPLNVWNIQDEYKSDFNKMKFLEVDLEPGNLIYIPAYWWYSIQILEENTSILSFKYRTYMNNVAILPQLILKIMQKQNIKHKIDRNYNTWSWHEIENMKDVTQEFNCNPIEKKLFTGDIVDSSGVLKESIVREATNIPGIMIYGNKTYGRSNKGKFYYKCIPNDKRLPSFLVTYEQKDVGFNKKMVNKFVLFRFHKWEEKHPIGAINQIVGDINVLSNFYEYQLYCKNLYVSLSY
jgi:hypothetical protein